LDRDAVQFLVAGLAGALAAITTTVLGDLRMAGVILGCLALAFASFLVVRRWGHSE